MAASLRPDMFSLPSLPKGIIHPEGTRRATWDIILALLLGAWPVLLRGGAALMCVLGTPAGYVAASVPLVIFFMEEQDVVHIAIDFFVDALFIMDIGLNFRTGKPHVPMGPLLCF